MEKQEVWPIGERLENRSWVRIIVFVLLPLAVGLASTSTAALAGVGVLIYVFAVFICAGEGRMKAMLLPFLLFTLFQETIVRMASPTSIASLLSYVDELFLLIFIPAMGIQFIRGKEVKGKVVLATVICLLLVGTLSSYLNEVPISTAVSGAFLLLKGLLYLFIFINLTYTQEDLAKYVRFVKWAAIVVLFFTVIDLAIPVPFRTLLGTAQNLEYRMGGLVSVQSLFIHPVLYGWFCAFVGMYLLAKFKETARLKVLLFSFVLLGASMLSFRFKTVASIFVIIALLYMLMGVKKSLERLLPFAFIAFFAVIAFGDMFTNLMQMTMNRYMDVDWMESARTALYHGSTLAAGDNFPFGAGFGRYGGHVAATDYSPLYYMYNLHTVYGLWPDDPRFATDTYWPNVLGELGYTGMFVLIGMMSYVIIVLLNGYKRMKDEKKRIFILFAALVFIQAQIEATGSPIFNSPPRNILVFAVVGIALSLLHEQKKKTNHMPEGRTE